MTKINVVTLRETTTQRIPSLYSFVEKCVICGGSHMHSISEGYRVGHCADLKHSTTYKLVIDRDNPENIRLAEKYGIQLDSSHH